MCSKVSVFIFAVGLYAAVGEHSLSNRFSIESSAYFSDTLTQGLRELNFHPLYKITPSVFIFEYQGNSDTKQALLMVKKTFQTQIKAIEPTRVYINSIKPMQTMSDGRELHVDTTNLVCSEYYGMGVQKVWERNITGKGVTIGINDVGIDTDLYDLEGNINKRLCKNFLTNTSDVSPDHMTEIMDKASLYTDHGNQVASVTAAIKNNNVCSAGIAYNATLVALKIYEVVLYDDRFIGLSATHSTKSEILSRALTYELDEIDIFVNAWGLTAPFDQLDLASRNAIEYGATTGRQGRGTIYIVPAGPCGNELTNNIYTISVNSFGRYGAQPSNPVLDASVLVSGLSDGNNLTAAYMITTSYGNKCVRTFKGLSAAVSQVSGTIALGLQANPDLTLRDVQHLLVQAAEHKHLRESIAFKTNGAFRHFHNIFGFGLLNADKFVKLAQKRKPVSMLLSLTLRNYKKRTFGYHTQTFEFCYSCDIRRDLSCLFSIEHVKTTMNFTAYADKVTTELISPSKTQSVVMELDFRQDGMPITNEGNITSVHFWDEIAFGTWSVKVQNKHSLVNTLVHNVSITLYGTRRDSKAYFTGSYLKYCGRDNTDGSSSDDYEKPQVVIPKTTVTLTESKVPTEHYGLSFTFVVILILGLVSIVCCTAVLFMYFNLKPSIPVVLNGRYGYKLEISSSR